MMSPDDRIARIVWDRIQDDFERHDDMIYAMQFCIANISALISKQFRPNASSLAALESCRSLILMLGWNVEHVLLMERFHAVFIAYIRDVVAMYSDTRQEHCERAQCILAMNMNSMLLQDLEYVLSRDPSREIRLRPAFECAVQLRGQMIEVFGFDRQDH